MRQWPTSVPDYAWPEAILAEHSPIKRWMLTCVFHIAHVLGRVMALFEDRVERILVIRTDGVGDGLLFEPAIRSLSRTHPAAQLHLWAPRLTCDLLRHCPAVTRRMAVPRGFKAGNIEYFGSLKWRWRIGYALGRWEFKKVIYPARSPEPLGNWLFESARATERSICDGDTINQFESQRDGAQSKATLVLKRADGHELVQNQLLAKQWNDPVVPDAPMVHLTHDILKQADAQIEAWRVEMQRLRGREIIGVVPAGSISINSYPPQKWVSALSRLWSKRRCVPVLLGGPEDQRLCDRLANLLRADRVPCLRLFMKTGILEMAALIARLDGVLTVDTGLAHLAVAQHVPTVVLTAGGNPGRFFPWPAAPHHIALNVKTPCAGCYNRCNQPEPICITQITPDEIANAYAQLKTRSAAVQFYVGVKPAYQKAG